MSFSKAPGPLQSVVLRFPQVCVVRNAFLPGWLISCWRGPCHTAKQKLKLKMFIDFHPLGLENEQNWLLCTFGILLCITDCRWSLHVTTVYISILQYWLSLHILLFFMDFHGFSTDPGSCRLFRFTLPSKVLNRKAQTKALSNETNPHLLSVKLHEITVHLGHVIF